MSQLENQYDSVKEYYGQVLGKSSDLKTDACCCPEGVDQRIAEILPLINHEIRNKYYGCGSPVPLCLEGLEVLDLGCGTGRDCYVMSKLVGKDGFVCGIDMTENQIAIAGKYINEQMKAFGYKKENVKFIFDYIESASKYFEKESLDLVTSNCVINLTEDKEVVLRSVYELLRFGGEMYFSDVYADRRMPEELSKDRILRGECLGGALYYRDFERIARRVGFCDSRIVSKRTLEINNPKIQLLVENTKFYSVTYRLWKLKGAEEECEDYGHTAVYNGQIADSPSKFELDSGHIFYKNKPKRICGNTALMLCETRFKRYFQVHGDFKEHFGAFENCSGLEQNNRTDSDKLGCC